MGAKIFIPVFIIFLVGMVAYLLWPQKKPVQTIASLKSALSDSQHLECDYTDADGLITKTYLKDGMLRSDFIDKKNDENSGAVLLRNGKTYVWWTQSKEGMFASSVDDDSKQRDQLLADMERYKNFCKPTETPDSLFTVPNDVTFRDYYRKVSPTESR